MTDEIIYKVLWVDDDQTIVKGTQIDADAYGIELDHYSNWQEAEVALKNNFDDYTAIILDAFCQISPNEDIQEGFIHVVLPSLATLFGEKHKFLPWYILSSGTMSGFSETVKIAKYHHQIPEWGNMEYIKDAPDDDPKNASFLYENIRRVGKAQANNTILFRHKDVFDYLGKDKLIDERARKLMLKMLSALYYPEENIKYEYAGNPLRKVVEYIFRAARKMGLLTDKCFDSKDHIVLLDASRYLAGKTINCYQGKKITHQARWGKPGPGKDGDGGDSVFPQDIAMLVKNILNYSSSDSHTYEELPYFIDEQNKELFFGYVMQLSHVIKWFGKYSEEHSDIEGNKKNQVLTEMPSEDTERKEKSKASKKEKISLVSKTLSIDEVKGRTYLIMQDGATYYCGSCKLGSSVTITSGLVKIEEVVINECDDKDKYPYVATKVSRA